MANPTESNPYAPPAVPAQAGISPFDHDAGNCPRCGSADTRRPGFTWWGGAFGPKLFKHTVCRQCGFGYNWQTRASNRRKIVTYTIIVNAMVVVALVAFFALR